MYFQMAEDEAQGIESGGPDVIQSDNVIVDELVSQERIDAENERLWKGRGENRTWGKGGKQTGNPKCRQKLRPKATAIGNQRTSSSRSRSMSRSRTQMPPTRRGAQYGHPRPRLLRKSPSRSRSSRRAMRDAPVAAGKKRPAPKNLPRLVNSFLCCQCGGTISPARADQLRKDRNCPSMWDCIHCHSQRFTRNQRSRA